MRFQSFFRSTVFTAAAVAFGLAYTSLPASAKDEVEYRPGSTAAGRVWDRFYAGDHEAELSDPLIDAGKAMTGPICEAIAHPDMKFRRYAIGALGSIRDERSIPHLEKILKNLFEKDYFRADALEAIHEIDPALGAQYAKRYQFAPGLLSFIAKEILAPR
jgi:hypothetical protein